MKVYKKLYDDVDYLFNFLIKILENLRNNFVVPADTVLSIISKLYDLKKKINFRYISFQSYVDNNKIDTSDYKRLEYDYVTSEIEKNIFVIAKEIKRIYKHEKQKELLRKFVIEFSYESLLIIRDFVKDQLFAVDNFYPNAYLLVLDDFDKTAKKLIK